MYHSVSPKIAVQYGLKEALLINILGSHIQNTFPRQDHDGRRWMNSSIQSIANSIPYFTANTVRRVIDSLERQGVILKGNFSDNPMDRTQWLAFVDESAFGL